jgi:Putative metallopeptidase
MKSCLPWRMQIPLVLTALAFAPGPADAQPAPAQPAPAQPAASPQAKVDAFAQGLAKNPKFKKLSPKYLQAVTEFVIGNTLFVMLHELGHAVTNQLKIPVLGRKEDAADMFAATRLIKFNKDFTDGALDAAARGWFMTDRRDTKTGDQVPYYDEHGLDQQRAYQIVCLMVGTGDPKYQALADETKLPKDRQKSCSGDYADASGSWDAAMMPYLRTPDQPKTKIDVVYGEGKDDLDVIAQGLRSVGLLEAIADRAASALAWPEPFTVEAQSCGYLNAAWIPDKHKLFLCYELAQDFADLYRDYGETRQSGRKRKAR